MEHRSHPEQSPVPTGINNPTVEALRIRRELLRLRKESGFTQEQVAARFDWHVSKMIRIEGGITKVNKVTLDALLALYDIDDPQIHHRLHASRQQARQKSWWEEGKITASPEHRAYIDYEAGASTVLQAENAFLPGLLQTPEYTLAMERMIPGLSGLYARCPQEYIQHPSPQLCVLDEGVLRKRVGADVDDEIMPTQLEYLAAMAKDSPIDIRVVPLDVGSHPGILGSFTIFSFEDMGEILYTRGGGFEEGDNPARISQFHNYFQQLIAQYALPKEASAVFIRQVVTAMRST